MPAFAPVLSCAGLGTAEVVPELGLDVAPAGTVESTALLLATAECDIDTVPTSLTAVELGIVLAICVTVSNICGAGAFTTKSLGS